MHDDVYISFMLVLRYLHNCETVIFMNFRANLSGKMEYVSRWV